MNLQLLLISVKLISLILVNKNMLYLFFKKLICIIKIQKLNFNYYIKDVFKYYIKT